MSTLKRLVIGLLILALAVAGIAWLIAPAKVEQVARRVIPPLPFPLPGLPPGPVIDTSRPYTVEERIAEIGARARAGLVEKFQKANAAWPPAEVTLVAIKDENTLELHTKTLGAPWQRVHVYPVLKASGVLGPKLKQGDKQVPEGIYRVMFLNANSRFHVSLRLDYPNAFDLAMGAKDGRADLGGDIMIHGKAVSVGCLAMGDEAAEELFFLANAVGMKNIKVIIAPTDFRKGNQAKPEPGAPSWVGGLYTEIARELGDFKS